MTRSCAHSCRQRIYQTSCLGSTLRSMITWLLAIAIFEEEPDLAIMDPYADVEPECDDPSCSLPAIRYSPSPVRSAMPPKPAEVSKSPRHATPPPKPLKPLTEGKTASTPSKKSAKKKNPRARSATPGSAKAATPSPKAKATPGKNLEEEEEEEEEADSEEGPAEACPNLPLLLLYCITN